jgi:hypothetical protein
MRYRDLLRQLKRQLASCEKSGAPDWLVSYAKHSIAKANYFYERRRGHSCSARAKAVNQLLQLGDVLRHWKFYGKVFS